MRAADKVALVVLFLFYPPLHKHQILPLTALAFSDPRGTTYGCVSCN